MSQNQIIAAVAAVVILIAIIGWAVMQSGSDFTAATAGTFAATADTSGAEAALAAWNGC